MYDFHYNFIKKSLILFYCLLIQTVFFMKSYQKMFMKDFLNTNISFGFGEFQSIFFIQLTKELLAK